jgi:DivIVA domain-containing protein
MDLTARDVHEKQFHDAWRGYNQEEVDDFLDKIAEALDRLRRENDSLRSRISDLDQVVATSRDTESMLKKTLVSAQKAAEDALQNAKARAEQLITEADERMQRANEEARERVRAAEEEARERVSAAEEEARRKRADAERERAEKTRALDSSIDQLSTYESELKQRLRAFLEGEIKSLDELTEKQRSAPARSEPRPEPRPEPRAEPRQQQQSPQPAPSGQRLHAAPASSYREREAARPTPRQQPEPRTIRADSADEGPDPVVRRRRPPEETQPRRGGLRGFFWGGDQG